MAVLGRDRTSDFSKPPLSSLDAFYVAAADLTCFGIATTRTWRSTGFGTGPSHYCVTPAAGIR